MGGFEVLCGPCSYYGGCYRCYEVLGGTMGALEELSCPWGYYGFARSVMRSLEVLCMGVLEMLWGPWRYYGGARVVMRSLEVLRGC